MNVFDLVDDAVMDPVCSRAFRNRTSMDEVTEQHILEAMRGEADMLDAVPSALQFNYAIGEFSRMKALLSLFEKLHGVKMGVADLVNKIGWRQAVRQNFNYVPRYGRLVVDALLEGLWPDNFRERVVAEARFREISDNPIDLRPVERDATHAGGKGGGTTISATWSDMVWRARWWSGRWTNWR